MSEQGLSTNGRISKDVVSTLSIQAQSTAASVSVLLKQPREFSGDSSEDEDGESDEENIEQQQLF